MVRRSAVNREIQEYLKDLEASGFRVEKAYLFGSMYNGQPHAYSDYIAVIESTGKKVETGVETIWKSCTES